MFSVPNQREECFLDIDFHELKRKNIKYIISDIDQTLLAQSTTVLSSQMQEKIEEIKNIFGEKSLCFLTNEPSQARYNALYSQVNIPTIDTKGVQKPLPEAFEHAMNYFSYKSDVKDICFIGDRVWTDILGANQVGLYTIKVEPYAKKLDRYSTKILRILENITLKIMQ